ncbi:MAG: fibronectin type III domain-containing protein [bacterium JZ-2024 1]
MVGRMRGKIQKRAVYGVLCLLLPVISCGGGGGGGGRGPLPPSNPVPADNAVNVSIKPTFSWEARHINPTAQMFYHFYLSRENPPTQPAKLGLTATTYTLETLLETNTTYYWKVLAIDGEGNMAESPVWRFTTSISSDITPPDTRITRKEPDRPKFNSAMIKAYFDSTEPNSTFQCRIDEGSWVSCTSGQEFSVASLSDGVHRFSVRAFDAVGNADPTPAVWEFQIDRTPPGNPVDLHLKAGDGVIQVSWGAPQDEDLAGFRIYSSTRQGFDFRTCGCLSMEVGKTVTRAELENLQNGQVYYVRVTAMDEAGNESGSTFEESASPDEVRVRVSDFPKSGLDVGFDGERYLVVWSENKGQSFDIYGQFVHPAGWLEGGELVIHQGAGDQINPRIVYDNANGYYVVVWEDWRNGNPDVYAVLVNRDGTVRPPAGGIQVTTDANFQISPDVAVNVQGALVVWLDYRTTPPKIRGARLISGQLEDPDGFDISSGVGRPRVAGGKALFLVVWQEMSSHAGFEHDIFGARVSWTGTLDIQPFAIYEAEGNQIRPVVAVNDPGDPASPFWVMWEERDSGGAKAVRVLPTGEVGSPQPVLSGQPQEQTYLDLLSIQDSELFLTWTQFEGSIRLIRYQKFRDAGGSLSAITSPARVSRFQNFSQGLSKSAYDGRRFFVIWLDARDVRNPDPPDPDVFGHLLP